MIKLKNKPASCEECPFGYSVEGYERREGKIHRTGTIACGALRGNADFGACPLSEENS